MSDRGKFSGFSWHTEFHTVNKKKEKAADCIYLTTDRICQCKDSYYYTLKCFSATHCPVRVKENEKILTEIKPPKKEQVIINCTLPKNCVVHSKRWNDGKYVRYEKENRHITISFNGKEIQFMYPDAFINKHLIVTEDLMKIINKDIANSKKV